MFGKPTSLSFSKSRLKPEIKEYLTEKVDLSFYKNGSYLNLQKVCLALGLRMYEADFENDNLCGAIVKESGLWTIYVNEAHHPNRKRFTAAHEIGHFVSMECGSYSESKLADGEHEDCLYRTGVGEKDPAEIEANQIASDILMPTEMVEQIIKTNPAMPCEDMALRFGVSTSAMTFRLKNLGYTLVEDDLF